MIDDRRLALRTWRQLLQRATGVGEDCIGKDGKRSYIQPLMIQIVHVPDELGTGQFGGKRGINAGPHGVAMYNLKVFAANNADQGTHALNQAEGRAQRVLTASHLLHSQRNDGCSLSACGVGECALGTGQR